MISISVLQGQKFLHVAEPFDVFHWSIREYLDEYFYDEQAAERHINVRDIKTNHEHLNYNNQIVYELEETETLTSKIIVLCE